MGDKRELSIIFCAIYILGLRAIILIQSLVIKSTLLFPTVHRWQVEPKDGDKIILPLPEGLPNGVYLLRTGGGKIVGKVVLVR